MQHSQHAFAFPMFGSMVQNGKFPASACRFLADFMSLAVSHVTSRKAARVFCSTGSHCIAQLIWGMDLVHTELGRWVLGHHYRASARWTNGLDSQKSRNSQDISVSSMWASKTYQFHSKAAPLNAVQIKTEHQRQIPEVLANPCLATDSSKEWIMSTPPGYGVSQNQISQDYTK